MSEAARRRTFPILTGAIRTNDWNPMRTLIILALLGGAIALGIVTTIDGVTDGRTLLAIILIAAAAITQAGARRR